MPKLLLTTILVKLYQLLGTTGFPTVTFYLLFGPWAHEEKSLITLDGSTRTGSGIRA